MMTPMSPPAPDDDDRATRAATDWRAVVRVLGPRGAAWSLPLADVIWGAVCLMIAITNASFLSRFGVHFVYVADLVLHALIPSPQLLRRRALRASFVVTAVGLALYALLTYSSPVVLGLSPLSLTALTSLHAVVRWSPDGRWRRAALGAALAGAVLNPINMLALGRAASAPGYLAPVPGGAVLMIVCAVATGASAAAVLMVATDARQRRRLAEERARLADRERDAAVARERLELARELHDLLGHSLTAIKVQASTALAVGDPRVLRPALAAVERTAGASLEEVRELVRALRSGAADASAAPVADLADLDRAIGAARAAGLDLSVRLPGEPVLRRAQASWSLAQRLTVLRAVQEGLTNALRHGAGSARLSMRVGPGRCTIAVLNPAPGPGAGPAPGAPGTGLVGLNERVRLVGGRLEAGPHPQDDGSPGFRLLASLPVNAAASGGVGARDAAAVEEGAAVEDAGAVEEGAAGARR